MNLLDNALGHNPPGTRVSISAAAAGPGGIAVSVLDDGAGMPADMASAPFEPARRRRSPTAGAGLGLSHRQGNRRGARRPDRAGTAGEGDPLPGPPAGRDAGQPDDVRGEAAAGVAELTAADGHAAGQPGEAGRG